MSAQIPLVDPDDDHGNSSRDNTDHVLIRMELWIDKIEKRMPTTVVDAYKLAGETLDDIGYDIDKLQSAPPCTTTTVVSAPVQTVAVSTFPTSSSVNITAQLDTLNQLSNKYEHVIAHTRVNLDALARALEMAKTTTHLH